MMGTVMGGSLRKESLDAMLVNQYGQSSGIRFFVETGTFHGETVAEMCDRFEQVHTIELSEPLYQAALAKFQSNQNVFCHHGDSSDELERLLPYLAGPTVFYLDAHFSGEGTALGREEVPLLRELAVLSGRRYRDIIIIDDRSLFGRTGTVGSTRGPYKTMVFDWRAISVDSIRRTIGQPGSVRLFPMGDRLVILTNRSLVRDILLATVRKLRTARRICRDGGLAGVIARIRSI